MLQIKNISKKYKTGDLIQTALNDVSLNLRDNEFVAILGPSGSGKTTLLNIIGGLDRYDSGDLIINGISTKKYKDRDWDSYRNHTIGFVFQSYNLIPHQTILANVELALTISGISKAERRKRAREALIQVGLGEQVHKRPTQMSGGQMQRVAIARALVNNPDIVLADEPTGALDSETSLQVMELLKEVAKDRLVVMVTHNPELADQYANRIVKLKDGTIRSDSNPYEIEEEHLKEPEHKNMGKSSMSFLTALSLSFNNLRTKKARTLLTAFAGSIGIIGIALILSLSTGANDYIQSVEEETLSEYPLQIQSTGFDVSALMVGSTKGAGKEEDGDIHVVQMVTDMFSTMNSNDLESLKEYLDSGNSGMEPYTKAIEYTYNSVPQIYRQDDDTIRQVNPDKSFDSLGFGSSSGSNSMMSSMMSTDVFYEMPENASLYENQYDVKAGRWPASYNECVVVLNGNGSISDFMLYTLGLRDAMELDEMIQQFINEETIQTPDNMGSYTYEDILGTTFKLVNSSDYYEYDSEHKVWTDKTDNKEYMNRLVENGENLKVVGVVKPAEGANGSALSPGIGYPVSLTQYVAKQAKNSRIVQQQIADPNVNVFTNEPFSEAGSSQNPLDMDSLFTVDTVAIQNAFKFDENALSGGLTDSMDLSGAFQMDGDSLDLSGMINLGDMNLTLPEMEGISLESLLSGLNLTVSGENMEQLVNGLLKGYQDYTAGNPQADYTKLGDAVFSYLASGEVQDILTENIKKIIQENGGGVTVSAEQLQAMAAELMTGYQAYAAEQGYTDSERFDEYLIEYLQTAGAQEILIRWSSEIFQNNVDISVTAEQIQKLASEIADGYQQYAAANNLPDPSMMGQYFMDYLNTDGGRKQLSDGIYSMVDVNSLEAQIATVIQEYMQKTMGSFTEAMSQTLETQMSSLMQQIVTQISQNLEGALQSIMTQAGNQLQSAMGDAMQIDEAAFAKAFQMKMDQNEMSELLMSLVSTEGATYKGNLEKLGYVDFSQPTGINIYPLDFVSKEHVVSILDDYNTRMEDEGKDEQVISYTDIVGTMMSSVTDIIDIISYVLIAFVAISLVVSSIMIGVITYISVLERKKEIGILRAIGASKGNVSQIFNAETFIIGLCAGGIGIMLTLLILIPGNALIHHLADSTAISAVLPIPYAVILILLSVLLTILGGLIPSSKAAKNDPVTALRVE